MKKKLALMSIVVILLIVGIATSIYLLSNNNVSNTDIIMPHVSNHISDYLNESDNISENNMQNEVQSSENSNIVENEELFSEFYEQAENLLQSMTLEEKVSQIFLVRFSGDEAIQEITNYNPGGYILFDNDFKNETKDSITQKLQECQNASKIKLILGVDEEGGTVVRVSKFKAFRESKFLSPQDIWQQGGLNAILEDSTEKSNLLKSIGLNMNLTPVADVPTNSSAYMYKRAYGRGVEETAVYVSELIKTMNNDEIISAMKHFPGYGDNGDTHTDIVIDEREYSVFENSDFIPFSRGIEAEVPCILVSHNIVKSMDADKPASLSENVHNILRNELNFSGIIMTDDLRMDAVKQYVENGEAAVQAVLAGNDMIISSNFVEHRNQVLEAIQTGKISEEQINRAVKRILALKYKYKII